MNAGLSGREACQHIGDTSRYTRDKPFPHNPPTGDVCADIPTSEDVGQELSPPADSPIDSSAYSTPGKFRLQLRDVSSILWAESTPVPAETGFGSPLMSVSILAHQLCEQSSPALTNVANVWLAEGAGPFQAISKY